MNYRYILDSSSKKHRCTKCNKNTLVGFIDTETGELMPIDFGRCDRESKCGFFEAPKGSFTKQIEYKYEAPKPVSYHDYNLVTQSGRNFKENNFIQFLKSLFDEAEIKEIILKYLIGTSKQWQGATVFWQIDNNENVRHGKIMLYDSITGKRQKNENGKAFINSVRSVLRLKEFNLKQCLFGLHLINESKTKRVAIVESEKTAIIMSLYKPEYIWMATGSKSGFKYEMLKPLRDFNIIGFPDKSEYDYWLNTAIELNSVGFNIKISNYIENTECENGTDLADIFLIENKMNKLKDSSRTKENVSQYIPTETEKKLNKIVDKNPVVMTLIKVFDLTDKNGTPIRITA
jgi:hypothetical protein